MKGAEARYRLRPRHRRRPGDDAGGCPRYTFDDLLIEIVGSRRSFPIVTNFDCGHTRPMLTIAKMTRITLHVGEGYDSRMIIEEPMVTPG
jgi:muramoyltetrapeptide carboxypeptidase